MRGVLLRRRLAFQGGLTGVILTFVPDIADPFRRSHIFAVCAA
jgi:hypothetical protein